MTAVTPRSRPKQRGLGPAWTVLIGAGVAQAVGRGHLASAPLARQRHAVLCGHECGVGDRQRLGADEVLLHPAQPRAPQRGHVLTYQRLEAGVGGTGWSTAQTLVAMSAARASPSGVGEPIREAGARVDLEDPLGQVEPRAGRAPAAARSAIGLGGSSSLPERLNREVRPVGGRDDRQGRIGGRALGRLAVRARSRHADSRPRSSSAEGETPQRAAHRGARGLPRGTGRAGPSWDRRSEASAPGTRRGGGSRAGARPSPRAGSRAGRAGHRRS